MTPTYRHFNTKPDEFEATIDDAGTLLGVEWRKNVEENEDGTFTAKCCFSPQFCAAGEATVQNALIGLYMRCEDADKGDMMEFYLRAQAFAKSLFSS